PPLTRTIRRRRRLRRHRLVGAALARRRRPGHHRRHNPDRTPDLRRKPVIPEIVKWVIVAYMALNALACVTAVGKPRGPLTGGQAATAVAINTLMVCAIVAWWG